MNANTLSCIKDYRHQHYDKTVKIADFSNKIVTGEGYGSLVVNYKPRETDEQKKQRVEITNCASKSIAGKIEGFFKRPFRLDKVKYLVEPQDESYKSTFLYYVDSFGQDGESVLDWCEKTALNQNGIDPNAFVWVKQSMAIDGKMVFNPIVFHSCNILDFSIKNGAVEMCVLRMQDTVNYIVEGKVKSYTIDIYYTFTKELIEISLEYVKEIAANSEYYTKFENAEQYEVNKKNFITVSYQNAIGFVPVCRLGYNHDKTTECQTYITYWDNATELYKEQANRSSEYALSIALHTFLQKVSYYTDCEYQSIEGQCKGGQLFPSKVECPNCKGTGQRKFGTTTQDIIEIKLPDSESDFNVKISPKDLVHYVDMPLEIVKLQKEIVGEYAAKIAESIFGVDVSHQNNESTTATQVINYYDTAQDTIYDFTQAPKNLFLFCMKTIAAYLGVKTIVNLQYPQQFDLESESYLLDILDKAKKSNASPEIIENIIDRLVVKQNRFDGTKLQVYKAMRGHKPFADLSSEMVQSYVLTLPETDLRKIFYLNFKQIADEVYNTIPNFLLLNFKAQGEKIKEITTRISKEVMDSNSVMGVSEVVNSSLDIPIA